MAIAEGCPQIDDIKLQAKVCNMCIILYKCSSGQDNVKDLNDWENREHNKKDWKDSGGRYG